MEFEEFIRSVDALLRDSRRRAPGRQAEIDQWLAGFNVQRDQLVPEVMHIQERGEITRGEYVDTVTTALLIQSPRVEDLAAMFAAITWELGLLASKVAR